MAVTKYSEDEPRDERRRWTSGGGTGGNDQLPEDLKGAPDMVRRAVAKNVAGGGAGVAK